MAPNPPPDVMIRLADETGGRAFYFNNDLAGLVRTAIADAEVSYTLGFYPDENGFDGKFHNIAVKVSRPDVEARHRSGYLALKDQAPNEKERRAILTELIASPFDASQIGLVASVQPSSGSQGAYRVLLKIDVADLDLARQNDRWTGTLELVIHLESSKQKTVQVRTIPVHFAEEDFRTALSSGLVLEDTVTTKSPADRLRIVVQDRATGFAGSLRVPIAGPPR